MSKCFDKLSGSAQLGHKLDESLLPLPLSSPSRMPTFYWLILLGKDWSDHRYESEPKPICDLQINVGAAAKERRRERGRESQRTVLAFYEACELSEIYNPLGSWFRLDLNTPNAGFNSPRTLHVKKCQCQDAQLLPRQARRLDAKANSIRAACSHGQVEALNNFGVP